MSIRNHPQKSGEKKFIPAQFIYGLSLNLLTTLGRLQKQCIKKFLGEKYYLTEYRDWLVEIFIKEAEALKKYYTNLKLSILVIIAIFKFYY